MSDPVTIPAAINPNLTPAGSSGDSGELAKLREDNARLQREAQGFKTEMLSEREKRQELERSRNAPAVPNGGTVLQPHADKDALTAAVKPLFEEVVSMKAANEERRALSYFARKEKLAVEDPDDVDAIKATPNFKELQQVIEEHKLHNMPMRDGIKTAHELLTKKRDAAAKAATDKAAAEEETRRQQIAAQGTAPGIGMPPAGSKLVKVNRADIGKMSIAEYSAMKAKAAKDGETILVE